MTDRHQPLDGEAGFSLVELLVVTLITAVIGTGIVGVVAAVSRAETRVLDRSENLDAARLAVDRVREVVRGAYGVCDDSTEDTLRVWRADTDRDLRIDPDELTTFTIEDGVLSRATGTAAASPEVDGLGDSGFTYYDRGETEVAPPLDGRGLDCTSAEEQAGRGDIATVGLRLAGDHGRVTRGGPATATTIDSQITLRNAVTADGTIQPNRTPTASFRHTCSPPSCTFDASESHDEDGNIVQYSWDFGDGSAGTTSLMPTTSHLFPVEGSFPVTLTVTDDGGASASVTQFIAVTTGNANPAAVLTVSCAVLTCTADGTDSFDVDGTITSYRWDFGDGTIVASGAPTQTHTYAVAGTYTVTLTVTDDGGATGSQSQTANPTATVASVRAAMVDVSTLASSTNRFLARVQITVTYPDGAPAANVNVRGRFGGDSAPLVSKATNAEGIVILQADGDYHRNTTVLFTVVQVVGSTLDATSGTTITLRFPG